MKRRVALILLLLVSGAIVNVAMAWGAAIFDRSSEQTTPIATSDPSPGVRWFVDREDHVFTTWVSSYAVESSSTILRRNAMTGFPTWAPLKTLRSAGQSQRFRASGWPARALWCEWIWDRSEERDTTDIWHWGLLLPMLDIVTVDGTERRALPLHPIWPGFAINTVFYAFVLWLLFAAPFALRRLRGGRRIKRGLCPKCAYPRGAGTNEVCTECGAAVVKQKAETQKAEIA